MRSNTNSAIGAVLVLSLLLLLVLIPAPAVRADDVPGDPVGEETDSLPGTEPSDDAPAEDGPAQDSAAEIPAADEPAPPLAKTSAPTANGPDIVPLTPVRLVDTRQGLGIAAAVPARTVRGVVVTGRGGIASDAVAVVLNVTVTQPAGAGWLAVFPCTSGIPGTSNINFEAGRTVPNQVTVQVGQRAGLGEVCFAGSVATHVVADVSAYYPAGSSFHPRAPTRIADTRPGQPTSVPKQKIGGANNVLRVRVAAPAVTGEADTAVLNVAVTEPNAGGFVTVYPCGQSVPLASSVNYVARQIVANAVTVRVGANAEVCVYSSARTHVVIDLAGWFPPGSQLQSNAPVRVADTRPEGPGWFKGAIPAAGSLTVPVTGTHGVPNGARAALLNLTVTQPAGAGWLVAYPCDKPRPVASNLNFVQGQTVANAVLVQLSTSGTFCLTGSAATQVVIDLGGYFEGVPRAPAAGSTFVRGEGSAQLFAVEPNGAVLPVTAQQLTAAGNPAVTVYPTASYQRAPYSPEVYAIAGAGAAQLVQWPRYVAAGTPAIKAVKTIPGTRFVKSSNSATVYAVAPSGKVTPLSAAQHVAAGSPAAQTVTAVPGSTYVKTERAPAVYAKAPDGTTRALTAAEYSALGSPKVQTLLWAPKSVAVTAADLWASYRAGCPVGPSSLVRLEFWYWDMAGRMQTGAIVAAKTQANTILTTMRSGFDAHFPLQRVTPVEAFGGSDVQAMAAGNTSAFNCRQVTGNPTRLSQHSYGNAIDINTFQNPYVVGKVVYPAGSDTYLNRSNKRPGMLYAGDPIIGPLANAGWLWGARWNSPDYQHLSSNGG